jgi:hypothetical protein
MILVPIAIGTKIINLKYKDHVVQLDRISDFGSEGWGFEPLRGHKKAVKIQYMYFNRFFYFIKIHLLSL